MVAVTTPTGSSPADTTERDNISAVNNNTPPVRTEAGNVNTVESLLSNRNKWGTTKPIKPITPARATP